MTHPRSQIRKLFVQQLTEQTLMQVSHYASPVYDRTFFAPTLGLQRGNDPLAIDYAWLKGQPEYADAEDC